MCDPHKTSLGKDVPFGAIRWFDSQTLPAAGRCSGVAADPFQDVLLTSVPDHEQSLARHLLPGAQVEARPLGPAVVQDHPDTRVLSVMIHDRPTPDLLGRLPRLEGVVTRSTGFDHLPLNWLASQRMPACYLPGYTSQSVAELTLALMLALVRRLPEAAAETGNQEAPGWRRDHLVGRRLDEITIGLLGVGKIGQATARTLSALGATVRGYDIAPQPLDVPGFRYVATLHDLLTTSDLLSIHVPLNDATRGLVGAKELALLPQGAMLVNTARGAVVNQEAVEAALRSGHLAGYAADVLPGEPNPPDLHRFAGRPNVILTPHLGAHNRATLQRRYQDTASACKAILQRDRAALEPFLAQPAPVDL